MNALEEARIVMDGLKGSKLSRHDIACLSMSLPFAVVLQQLISTALKPLRVNAVPLSGYARVFSRVTFARYFLA